MTAPLANVSAKLTRAEISRLEAERAELQASIDPNAFIDGLIEQRLKFIEQRLSGRDA